MVSTSEIFDALKLREESNKSGLVSISEEGLKSAGVIDSRIFHPPHQSSECPFMIYTYFDPLNSIKVKYGGKGKDTWEFKESKVNELKGALSEELDSNRVNLSEYLPHYDENMNLYSHWAMSGNGQTNTIKKIKL